MTFFLCRLLRSPSAYVRNPWGYVRNQAGHAYIVGALPVALGVPWWAVMAIYAVWEIVQWARYGSAPSDGLEDASHVAAGVLIGSGALAVIPMHAIMLAAGAQWRRENLM